MALPQNAARLNLVHEAAFAFKSFTHWTSHIALYFLLFYAVVKGSNGSFPIDTPTANGRPRAAHGEEHYFNVP